MPGEKSPWTEYEAKTWEDHIPEFPSIPKVKFTEGGNAAALGDLLYGHATGVKKDDAMAEIVSSSILFPRITKAEFNALGISQKLALYGAILSHAIGELPEDFSGPGPESPATASTPAPSSAGGSASPAPGPDGASLPETPAGGSGPQRAVSVSVRPKP